MPDSQVEYASHLNQCSVDGSAGGPTWNFRA